MNKKHLLLVLILSLNLFGENLKTVVVEDKPLDFLSKSDEPLKEKTIFSQKVIENFSNGAKNSIYSVLELDSLFVSEKKRCFWT
ncbi:MAG: hypothetical protein HXX81_02485 [Campylobacterales bacterium]|nr:hypothetical protein [Campylobacterales bacterium]